MEWMPRAEAEAVAAPKPCDCPVCAAGLSLVPTLSLTDRLSGKTMVFRGKGAETLRKLLQDAKL